MFGAVVWFGTFSLEACKRWYILPPVFKGTRCALSTMPTNIKPPPTVLQVMVSQFVLGIRYVRLIPATGESLLS
jgi:hypothetical protein